MRVIEIGRGITPGILKKPVHWARKQWIPVDVRQRYAPAPESVAASVLSAVRRAWAPSRTVLFYPSVPHQVQVVYKLCVLNNYRITNDPRVAHDLVHKHIDRTVSDTYAPVEAAGPRAINARSTDIRKERVQEVFREVFGYDLGVDPRTYSGRAVRKSDTNYRHDGAIVACPHEPDPGEEGVVYQKLVDTERPDGFCVDIRVPVFDGEVPVVYLKFKPADDRFHTITRAEIREPREVFSAEELNQIGALARAMGVDFGEMDVLRDNGDGRIYVVDVNNTPSGPQRGFSAEQRRFVADRLSRAYRQMVEARLR